MIRRRPPDSSARAASARVKAASATWYFSGAGLGSFVGADAVQDFMTVLRGGSIDPGKAQTLQAMGFLQPSDPSDPNSPLHLTEDAQPLLPPGGQRFVQLKPDVARYTPSSDPAHGTALYQNAVAGMEHFANTAQNMLPAPDASDGSSGAGTANAGTDSDDPNNDSTDNNGRETQPGSSAQGPTNAPAGIRKVEPEEGDGAVGPDGENAPRDMAPGPKAAESTNSSVPEFGDQTLLQKTSSNATNTQQDAPDNPVPTTDAEGGRAQNEDEKGALNRMRAIEMHIRLNAEAYADKAASFRNAGNLTDAEAAQNNARAEKQRADGLAYAISQIEALIKSSPNASSDPSSLRILDQAFHSWMNDKLRASYTKEADGGTRIGGPYGGSPKCNIALFDWLTGANVVAAKWLTRSDNGHARPAGSYNTNETQILGLSAEESQTWPHTDENGQEVKQTEWSGWEPKAGDIVTYGDTRSDAHATVSLGGGWHIGSSDYPGPEGTGQDAGININTDEFDHGTPGWFEKRMVRKPK